MAKTISSVLSAAVGSTVPDGIAGMIAKVTGTRCGSPEPETVASLATRAARNRSRATAVGVLTPVSNRCPARDVTAPAPRSRSGPPGEPFELRPSLLLVGLPALLGFVGGVEEQVGVMRQLLDSGVPVLGRVEAGLHQPQGEGRQPQHLAAPGDRLGLQIGQRYDGVHQTHFSGLLRVVLPAEEPDLLGLLDPDQVGQQAGAVSTVERTDLRPHLAEPGVVGGNAEIADQVEYVTAADRIAGDHGHHRLGQPADLDVQIGDVEPADGALLARLGQVPGVAADPLVTARAERVGSLAG